MHFSSGESDQSPWTKIAQMIRICGRCIGDLLTLRPALMFGDRIKCSKILPGVYHCTRTTDAIWRLPYMTKMNSAQTQKICRHYQACISGWITPCCIGWHAWFSQQSILVLCVWQTRPLLVSIEQEYKFFLFPCHDHPICGACTWPQAVYEHKPNQVSSWSKQTQHLLCIVWHCGLCQ